MSWKKTAAIGAGVIVLAISANQMLEPRTLQEMEKQRHQQQLDQASDADEQRKERMRADGEEGLRSENERKLVPGERRPPAQNPKHRYRIRLRLP